jgi:hypothetical protein
MTNIEGCWAAAIDNHSQTIDFYGTNPWLVFKKRKTSIRLERPWNKNNSC